MSLRENEHVQKWIEPTLLQTGELKWDGDVKQRELSVDNGLPHWKEAVVFPLGCTHEEGGGVPDPRAQISKEGKV